MTSCRFGDSPTVLPDLATQKPCPPLSTPVRDTLTGGPWGALSENPISVHSGPKRVLRLFVNDRFRLRRVGVSELGEPGG